MLIEKFLKQAKEEIIMDTVLSDEFMDKVQDNFAPIESLMAYYRCAIMEVETKFNVLNEQFSLQYDRNPIESIKARVKSFDSILKKVKRKQIPFSLESIEENINDIAGVRVICSFQEDIYMLADCLLQQDDVRLIERKDYIKNPKPGGYRSLHLIIEVPIFLEKEKRPMKVEVQLRTIAMDFWASLEHKIYYKFEGDAPDYISRDLRECAEMVSTLDEKMLSLNEAIKECLEKQEELNISTKTKETNRQDQRVLQGLD